MNSVWQCLTAGWQYVTALNWPYFATLAPLATAGIALSAALIAWRSMYIQRDTARRRAAIDGIVIRTLILRYFATALSVAAVLSIPSTANSQATPPNFSNDSMSAGQIEAIRSFISIQQPSISPEGEYIAFVGRDTSEPTAQVYVWDRSANPARLVSRVDGPANRGATNPAIAPGGEYVAFQSYSTNLLPGTGGTGRSEVYVSYWKTPQLSLASQNAAGQPGAGLSQLSTMSSPISAHGAFVVFNSTAGNLVPGSGVQLSNIYAKNMQTGEVTVVSKSSTASASTGTGHSVSGDGRFAAFISGAAFLPGVSGDQVYVRNLQTSEVRIASTNAQGVPAVAEGGMSTTPASTSISSDGRYVAFVSYATNLVPQITTRTAALYVKDMQTGEIGLAATTSAGVIANGPAYFPSISGDGRRLAFMSEATNLAPGTTRRHSNIFVKDMLDGWVTLLSQQGGIEGNAPSIWPSITADGRTIVWTSGATNLGPNTSGQSQLYITTF